MLPVLLFIALWVVLAVGLVLVALRPGRRARQAGPSRSADRTLGLVLVVIYLGFGIAIPVAFLTGNHANASAKVGNITLNANEKAGRELFGEHCGVCHTLAATNSVGKVGPNLDMLAPPASLVLSTIQNGCVQSPPTNSSPTACLGYGTMPANVIEGKEARQVAEFVGKVAGKE